MNTSIVDRCVELVKRRWLALLGVAVPALVPMLVATSLSEVLGPPSSAAIVDGQLVPNDVASSWTVLGLPVEFGGSQWRLPVPVLVVLGWAVGLAVSMRVLAGASVWAAWRQAGRRAVSWGFLCALLAMLATASSFASVLVAGVSPDGLARLLAVVAGVVCLYGLVRLTLALPAILVDGHGLVDAVRRAVAVTRGRVLRDATVLIIGGVALPGAAFLLAQAVAEGLASHFGRSFVGDVVWVGAGSLLEHLTLVVAVAVQAALLMCAYQAADVPAEGTPVPATSGVPGTSRIVVTGLALLVTAPAVVTSAGVIANPRRFPVASTAHPVPGFSSRPLALTVLTDGTTVTVDDMQVGLCYDVHCTDHGLVGMPCRDGAAPTAVGMGARGCSIEAPLSAADITPEGTLLALERGQHQEARFFWCRVVRDQMCQWGGATTLASRPEAWESWSMAVAATPTGGFAAALLGPGKDDRHGELLVATCEQLDCPQPAVRGVLEVAMPDVWHGGVVDIAVDRVSGSLALGYYDRTTGALWLGGCPAGCAQGPTMTQVGAWSEPVSDAPFPSVSYLDTAATATGPAAVVTVIQSDVSNVADTTEVTVVVNCDDLHCSTSRRLDFQGWTSARLAVDRAGEAFLVGNSLPGVPPALLNLRTAAFTALAVNGEVVAATFGADGRLRTIVHDSHGLVLATSYCLSS